MKCNKCGNEILNGAKFCASCGAPIETPHINTAPNSGITEFGTSRHLKPKMSGKKKLLIILASAVGGIIVITGIGQMFSGGSSSSYNDGITGYEDAGDLLDENPDEDYSKDYDKSGRTIVNYDYIRENASLLYPSSNSEWEYNVYQDNTDNYDKYVVLKKYLADSYDNKVTEMSLPDEIEGYPVLCVGEHNLGYDFMYTSALKKLVIPESVLCVENDCFEGAPLESLSLPSTLTQIGSSAFASHHLTKLNLPENLTEIGKFAFSGDKYWNEDSEKYERYDTLNEVTIPKSVERIGENGIVAHSVTVLNPDMDFSTSYYEGEFDFGGVTADTIYGYTGSTAAKYCAEAGIAFKSLD